MRCILYWRDGYFLKISPKCELCMILITYGMCFNTMHQAISHLCYFENCELISVHLALLLLLLKDVAAFCCMRLLVNMEYGMLSMQVFMGCTSLMHVKFV